MAASLFITTSQLDYYTTRRTQRTPSKGKKNRRNHRNARIVSAHFSVSVNTYYFTHSGARMHHTLRESNKGNNTFSLPLFLHFATLYFSHFQPRTLQKIVPAWGPCTSGRQITPWHVEAARDAPWHATATSKDRYSKNVTFFSLLYFLDNRTTTASQ